ncbi:hypothetical protein LXL04_001450 [Taraxacum kok-saghyz]
MKTRIYTKKHKFIRVTQARPNEGSTCSLEQGPPDARGPILFFSLYWVVESETRNSPLFEIQKQEIRRSKFRMSKFKRKSEGLNSEGDQNLKKEICNKESESEEADEKQVPVAGPAKSDKKKMNPILQELHKSLNLLQLKGNHPCGGLVGHPSTSQEALGVDMEDKFEESLSGDDDDDDVLETFVVNDPDSDNSDPPPPSYRRKFDTSERKDCRLLRLTGMGLKRRGRVRFGILPRRCGHAHTAPAPFGVPPRGNANALECGVGWFWSTFSPVQRLYLAGLINEAMQMAMKMAPELSLKPFGEDEDKPFGEDEEKEMKSDVCFY